MAIAVATDVKYIRFNEEQAGHAIRERWSGRVHTRCGRWIDPGTETREANRLPRDWHYCGNCSRSITAEYDEV